MFQHFSTFASTQNFTGIIVIIPVKLFNLPKFLKCFSVLSSKQPNIFMNTSQHFINNYFQNSHFFETFQNLHKIILGFLKISSWFLHNYSPKLSLISFPINSPEFSLNNLIFFLYVLNFPQLLPKTGLNMSQNFYQNTQLDKSLYPPLKNLCFLFY